MSIVQNPRGHALTLKRVLKWLSWAVVVGTAALALWWTGGWQPLWELFSDRERLRTVVENSGSLAPVAYMLLLVVQAILLPTALATRAVSDTTLTPPSLQRTETLGDREQENRLR